MPSGAASYSTILLIKSRSLLSEMV
jgi:hypothetical protein